MIATKLSVLHAQLITSHFTSQALCKTLSTIYSYFSADCINYFFYKQSPNTDLTE